MLFVLILILPFRGNTADQLQPKMKITYKKVTDGTRKITVSVSASDSGVKVYPEGVIITVSAEKDSAKVKLGTVSTDWKGKATFEIPAGRTVAKGSDGFYSFLANFDGYGKFAAVDGSVKVKDITLELNFDPLDTAKIAHVFAYEIGAKGEKIMVPNLDVDFCVTRIFCLYPFGTAKTDSTGQCSVAFPRTLPGDSVGEVVLVARIMDNDTYANVETRKSVKWGVPFIPELKLHRGLGDTDAPLWMVYTLIVLLSAVWFHFSYIIFLMLRINSIGKKMLRNTANSAV